MSDIVQNAYAGSGFYGANSETLENLHKALQAGSGADASSFTGGRALIPENLDQTLINVLHSVDEAILFQRLKKNPVRGPIHQWNYRDEVGADDGAWVPEGGDSEETDQDIERRFTTAKYLQTLRKVTLQMASSDTIGGVESAEALEEQAGTLWLIRNVERTLFTGRSNIVSEQFDGLDAQIENVIDLRGLDATTDGFEDAMNEATRVIRDHFGKADLMLGSTVVIEDVQKLLRDRIRFEVGTDGLGSRVFNRYPTPFGNPELKDDVFIGIGGAPAASSLASKRPAVPTINTSAAESASGASGASHFAAADAGDYFYQVVAINRYGDSVATAATSAVTVANGQVVKINVTEGDPAARGYKVYRSKLNGVNTDLRYAFSVPRTGATQDIFDTNSDLPGTTSMYVLTMDPARLAIEWVQFLPMMRFPLYPTNAAVYPFLMLLFGALAVKKPVQHVRIKNIAPSTLDWF